MPGRFWGRLKVAQHSYKSPKAFKIDFKRITGKNNKKNIDICGMWTLGHVSINNNLGERINNSVGLGAFSDFNLVKLK